jgi:hypothetical protein
VHVVVALLGVLLAPVFAAHAEALRIDGFEWRRAESNRRPGDHESDPEAETRGDLSRPGIMICCGELPCRRIRTATR